MKAFLSILLCLCLVGCATTQQQADEQLRQGVYAIHDSMEVGRFDQAKVYSDQLVRTVPAPKKRAPIKAFNADTP